MARAVPSLFRLACRASDEPTSDVCWTSPLTSNGRPDVDVQEVLCASVYSAFCACWPLSAAVEPQVGA